MDHDPFVRHHSAGTALKMLKDTGNFMPRNVQRNQRAKDAFKRATKKLSMARSLGNNLQAVVPVSKEKDHHTMHEIKASAYDAYLEGKKNRTAVIDPNSSYMLHWDFTIGTLLLFTATVTPFEVAFLDSGSIDFMFILNRIVDLFFLWDVYINCRLAYYNANEGRWVFDKKLVFCHYAKSWLFIDVVSLLPFDCIGLFYGSDSGVEQLKVLRTLKLLKLAKLLRVLRSSRVVKRIQMWLKWSHASNQLFQFVAMVLCVIHWAACIWRIAVDLEGKKLNWISLAQEKDILSKPSSAFELYIASVGFSLMVMVMGYGIIIPATQAEQALAVILMLTCGSVYAYTIGNICGLVSMRDPATIQYQETVDLVNKFLEENHLPGELRIQMRDFMVFCKQLIRNEIYTDVQETFPNSLRGKIAKHLNYEWISTVSYFDDKSMEENVRDMFITAVAVKLQLCALPPEECIYAKGDEATALYIIRRGMVSAALHILHRGKSFGSDMIMTSGVRQNSALCLTYVDLSMLHKDDLFFILDSHPVKFTPIRQNIRKAAIALSLRQVIRELGQSIIALQGPSYKRKSMEELQIIKRKMRVNWEHKRLLKGCSKKVMDTNSENLEEAELKRKQAEENYLKQKLAFWTNDSSFLDEDLTAQQSDSSASSGAVSLTSTPYTASSQLPAVNTDQSEAKALPPPESKSEPGTERPHLPPIRQDKAEGVHCASNTPGIGHQISREEFEDLRRGIKSLVEGQERLEDELHQSMLDLESQISVGLGGVKPKKYNKHDHVHGRHAPIQARKSSEDASNRRRSFIQNPDEDLLRRRSIIDMMG